MHTYKWHNMDMLNVSVAANMWFTKPFITIAGLNHVFGLVTHES